MSRFPSSDHGTVHRPPTETSSGDLRSSLAFSNLASDKTDKPLFEVKIQKLFPGIASYLDSLKGKTLEPGEQGILGQINLALKSQNPKEELRRVEESLRFKR